ncbi:hypothetical protein KY327_00110 [Candidatus Woesearchaeota archaeon]|nr:hypothetical protein [Candidatus Woesearchaeota archaeon]
MDKSVVFAVLSLLLCGALPVVAGLGYAPVTVVGNVTDGGVPVTGASVVLEAELEDRLVSAGPVVTGEDGLFATALTVPDGASVDVEVRISVGGDLFVELVRGVESWERYVLEFDLSDGRLERDAPASSGSSPTPPGFDEDVRALRDPAIPNGPVLERYNASVSLLESSREPVVEEPVTIDGGGSSPLAWVAVVALAACLLLLHLEWRRRA